LEELFEQGLERGLYAQSFGLPGVNVLEKSDSLIVGYR
jgi:hypothetical protein